MCHVMSTVCGRVEGNTCVFRLSSFHRNRKTPLQIRSPHMSFWTPRYFDSSSEGGVFLRPSVLFVLFLFVTITCGGAKYVTPRDQKSSVLVYDKNSAWLHWLKKPCDGLSLATHTVLHMPR